jgi:hypothetical protein
MDDVKSLKKSNDIVLQDWNDTPLVSVEQSKVVCKEFSISSYN